MNQKRYGKKAKAEASPPRTMVDLSKLRKSSLKRYKHHFKLDMKANPSKAELVDAVAAHFANMPVRESEVVAAFYNYARSRNSL
mmetsp:Transcript_5243/g.15682  ORF Transcript_5243/g.15682 Transcript_5243/m.15682 type:complete len:84 (-) Transcript_5243:269-520(-)